MKIERELTNVFDEEETKRLHFLENINEINSALNILEPYVLGELSGGDEHDKEMITSSLYRMRRAVARLCDKNNFESLLIPKGYFSDMEFSNTIIDRENKEEDG